MLLKHALVIGLTGSFGSGCSSLMDVLTTSGIDRKNGVLKFVGVSLSDFVKKKWLEDNWSRFNSSKPFANATEQELEETIKKAKRHELQTVGNKLRKYKHTYDKLAKLAIQKAYGITSGTTGEVGLVFDSIRNTAEIKTLKEKFPNFYLIAVDCDRDLRWGRVRDKYERNGQSESNFNEDDERDRGEDLPYGQQVELCVDEADIMIKNEDPYPERASRMMKLKEKIDPYMALLSGTKSRTPEPDEFFMSLAYTASLNSKCFKRQVGAVVVDADKNVLSVGYNENLQPHQPCVDDPGDCQRDIYKRAYFQKLSDDETAVCPKCKKSIIYSPEFKCKTKNCDYKLDGYFIPDKALSRCVALHAEARALRALKSCELREGTVLYTTASPCLLCAVEIANAGIEEVVYSEAYTDTTALEFLKKEHVNTRKFQGVKAQAYFKMFSSWRREKETGIRELLGQF